MMDKESYPGAKSTLQCVLPFRAQRHALPSSKRQPLFLSFISVVGTLPVPRLFRLGKWHSIPAVYMEMVVRAGC
jgi:hypothetical protein